MRLGARLYLCLLGLSWKYGTQAHIDAYWNAYPDRQIPKLWPEGGRFATPVAVTVDCPHKDSTVHYVTCYEYNMTMAGGADQTQGYYLSDDDCEFPTTVVDVIQNIDGVRWPPASDKAISNPLLGRHFGGMLLRAHIRHAEAASARLA